MTLRYYHNQPKLDTCKTDWIVVIFVFSKIAAAKDYQYLEVL